MRESWTCDLEAASGHVAVRHDLLGEPVNRRETIIELVRLLPEAVSPSSRVDRISAGPDSRVLSFGPLWYDAEHTWLELVRCLGLLKAEKPRSFDHMRWRYWGGYQSRRQIRIQRRRHDFFALGLHDHQEVRIYGPATINKNTLDCLVHTWPSWVNAREVDDATRFLEDVFTGEPYLPTVVIAA